MKYEAENLQFKNEEVKLVVMRHACSLIMPLLHIFIVLVLAVVSVFALANWLGLLTFDNFSLSIDWVMSENNLYYCIVLGFWAILLIVSLIELIVTILQNHSRFLIVTDKRVLYKWGVISKYEENIAFGRFDGATTLKPFKYRIHGCGIVIVNSTGARNITFGPVKHPESVADTITEMLGVKNVADTITETQGVNKS